MPGRKRTRAPRTKATKGKKKGGANSIRALQAKIDRMQINTSPFSAVGSTLGRPLGGLFGRPDLGASVGGWLGSGIGKIFGSGAYKMSKNSVWSTADQCPSMHSNSENVIVRHREYICDIKSSTAFTLQEFPLNPGLPKTFPFLSAMASNFQEYAFKGLVFEFRSTSADALNSTNTALGTVAMAVQYRAGATPFTNKQQILNEMWSADSKPSENFFMPVECAPSECPMDIQYIRTGALPENEDIKFYDIGKLSLATVGSQAVAVVGELWASYEVALKKPVLGSAIGSNVESAVIVRNTVSSGSPFGSALVTAANNSIGVVVTGASITFPSQVQGKFFVSLFWFGGTGPWTLPPFTFSGGTLIPVNGFVDQQMQPATGTGMLYQFVLSIPDNNVPCVITAGFGAVVIVPTTIDINIAQMDFDTVPT